MIFTLVLGAASSEMTDKLTRVVKLKLGLSPDLFQVIETEYQSERLIMIVIYGSEEALDSSLGNDIKRAFQKYRSQNPVAVSVLTRSKESQFHPYAVRIIQGDEKTPAKEIVGITDGFLDGKMPEKVPMEGKTFWGSKGIMTLGEDFDINKPFKVRYGTASANFSLAGLQQPQVASPESQPDQPDLNNPPSNPPADSSSNTMNNPNNPGGNSNQPGPGNSPLNNSKQGQGLALLAELGALLLVTLSLL